MCEMLSMVKYLTTACKELVKNNLNQIYTKLVFFPCVSIVYFKSMFGLLQIFDSNEHNRGGSGGGGGVFEEKYCS